MTKNFNTDHPEIRQGEVWVANATPEEIEEINWKTRRVGHQAYNSSGKPIPGVKPVFIQVEEAELAAAALKQLFTLIEG